MQGVVIDLMAEMEEGDVSAKGNGFSMERGNKPLGNRSESVV